MIEIEIENKNKILDYCRKTVLSDNDKKLICLIFKKNVTQQDLDEFLTNWDIEAEGGLKALLLSYFMKDHRELVFPPYVKPRLIGLTQYYRFRNLKLISDFAKPVKEFLKTGADIMIIKGFAMKYLRPEYFRTMNDIDILVDRKHYNNVIHISRKIGYDLVKSLHSTDLHNPDTKEHFLDIHRYIPFSLWPSQKQLHFSESLLKRSEKKEIFGLAVKIPSFEDMTFLTITNIARNLLFRTSLSGIPISFFDLQYLITNKNDFDWDRVIEDIGDTDTVASYLFGQYFVNSFIPDLLPDLTEKLGDKKKIQKKLSNYLYLMEYAGMYLNPQTHKLNYEINKSEKKVKWYIQKWVCRFYRIPLYINSFAIIRFIVKHSCHYNDDNQ